ncbi:MAG: hypothetical protein KDD60_07915, partial [Bdellovibrionales bacterium]|nr:hypothetical protein [Bdellovibrionales bacterium]
DSISLTVSDLAQAPADTVSVRGVHTVACFFTEASHVVRAQSNVLEFDTPINNPFSKLLDNNGGELMLTPVRWQSITSEVRGEVWKIQDDFRRAFGEGELYIRPLFDCEFERMAFGLHAVGSVDYRDLSSSFDEPFDFVFGRHLCPLSTNPLHQRQQELEVRNSIERVLMKEGGKGLVFFDDESSADAYRRIEIAAHP